MRVSSELECVNGVAVSGPNSVSHGSHSIVIELAPTRIADLSRRLANSLLIDEL